MNDAQMYDGKANSSQKIEQSVNSDPQAVDSTTPNNYGVPGLAKFFAKYPALTDLHKKMLAALYAEGESMKAVQKAARLLLGSEEYDSCLNDPQTSGFHSIKDLSNLQEAYNLEDSDMEMLEDLFESGHSAEVIISKAKRLANFEESDDTPLATHSPQISDEEFINSLKRALDLTPDDLMTVVGMMQKGVPRDLVERTAGRFAQYPAMANIMNHVLDLKSDEVATPAAAPGPKPSPELSAALEINTNAGFGNSHAEVLLFALTEYQDTRLKEATELLTIGDFSNAANELSDFTNAGTMVLELALSLSKLANNNYWAARGETPDHDCKPSNVFESYAKHSFGLWDERIQQYVKENY